MSATRQRRLGGDARSYFRRTKKSVRARPCSDYVLLDAGGGGGGSPSCHSRTAGPTALTHFSETARALRSHHRVWGEWGPSA